MVSTHDAPVRRTFAQWYCVVAGAVLVFLGVFGFFANSSFHTGGALQGDNFIVFEVNGWGNVVHLASGLFLLASANTRPTARAAAIAVGAFYVLVTLWGLIDGTDVFNLFPINPADNVLHAVLAVGGLACAYVSPTTKGQQRRRRRERGERRRQAKEERRRRKYIKGIDA